MAPAGSGRENKKPCRVASAGFKRKFVVVNDPLPSSASEREDYDYYDNSRHKHFDAQGISGPVVSVMDHFASCKTTFVTRRGLPVKSADCKIRINFSDSAALVAEGAKRSRARRCR